MFSSVNGQPYRRSWALQRRAKGRAKIFDRWVRPHPGTHEEPIRLRRFLPAARTFRVRNAQFRLRRELPFTWAVQFRLRRERTTQGRDSVHGLVEHLEPPLENHLNLLPRHKYAGVLKGHHLGTHAPRRVQFTSGPGTSSFVAHKKPFPQPGRYTY